VVKNSNICTRRCLQQDEGTGQDRNRCLGRKRASRANTEKNTNNEKEELGAKGGGGGGRIDRDTGKPSNSLRWGGGLVWLGGERAHDASGGSERSSNYLRA